MKKEQLLLDNAKIYLGERECFHHFSLHLYESEKYGILCDSIEERNALLDFFSGNLELQSRSVKYKGQEISSRALPGFFQKKAAVIRRKSKLIESFSIAENINRDTIKSRWERSGVYEREAEKELEYFGIQIDLSGEVRDLTQKERILTELLKAYAEKREIVVLADFFSELRKPELEEIHVMVEKLEKEGMTFLIVEPFGNLVFDWSDYIIIVKNQMVYGCFEKDFIDKKKLYRLFSHHDRMKKSLLMEDMEERSVLEFQQVSSRGLMNISFQLTQGEVLKILCMDESSLKSLEHIFTEGERNYRGQILLENREVKIGSIRDMRRKKICYCAPMAYQSMLIPDMTVRENIMTELSDKVRGIWMYRKYQKSVDNMIISWFGEDLCHKTVREIPYYQRQQLVFMKLYLFAPKLLICSQPFIDMDVRMKEIVRNAIKNFLSRGTAVLLLIRNIQDLSYLDGDVLYLKDGKMIEEDEVYQMLYLA